MTPDDPIRLEAVFVSRESAARRVEISVDTWDLWVRQGYAPQPAIRRGGVLRWHWPTVESRLAGGPGMQIQSDPFDTGVANATQVRRRAAS